MQRQESGLETIIKAAGKRAEYNSKIRTQVALMKLRNKMAQENRAKQAKQAFLMGYMRKKLEQRMDPKNAQMFTPEQDYLRRRAMEENPLMAMSVPEEGQYGNIPQTDKEGIEHQLPEGLSFPESVTMPNDKGMMGVKSPSADPVLQTRLLEQKVAEMQAQGKRVHPAILNLLNLQRQSAAEFEGRESPKFDYRANPTGKAIEIGKGDKEPNSATKKVLENLSKELEKGSFETRAQVLEDLEENAPALKVKDVDMDYVRSNVMKHLPKTFPKDKGFLGNILSSFGFGAKKPSLSEGSIDLLDEEANG